jgi:hypothetical protein
VNIAGRVARRIARRIGKRMARWNAEWRGERTGCERSGMIRDGTLHSAQCTLHVKGMATMILLWFLVWSTSENRKEGYELDCKEDWGDRQLAIRDD